MNGADDTNPLTALIPLRELRKAHDHDCVHDSRISEFIRITKDEPGEVTVRSFINDSGELQLMIEPKGMPRVIRMDDTSFIYRIIK